VKIKWENNDGKKIYLYVLITICRKQQQQTTHTQTQLKYIKGSFQTTNSNSYQRPFIISPDMVNTIDILFTTSGV